MEKVRLAIVGRNNSNLKDLGHLDGNDHKCIFHVLLAYIYIYIFTSTPLEHFLSVR